MDAVWAEERLREGGLTPDGIYAMVLQATGDPREAAQQKADAQAAQRRREFLQGTNGYG